MEWKTNFFGFKHIYHTEHDLEHRSTGVREHGKTLNLLNCMGSYDTYVDDERSLDNMLMLKLIEFLYL